MIVATVVPELWLRAPKLKIGHVMQPCPLEGQSVIQRPILHMGNQCLYLYPFHR